MTPRASGRILRRMREVRGYARRSLQDGARAAGRTQKVYCPRKALLVSWGGFKESVYREARTKFFQIRLWDADKLMQALLEHYD